MLLLHKIPGLKCPDKSHDKKSIKKSVKVIMKMKNFKKLSRAKTHYNYVAANISCDIWKFYRTNGLINLKATIK